MLFTALTPALLSLVIGSTSLAASPEASTTGKPPLPSTPAPTVQLGEAQIFASEGARMQPPRGFDLAQRFAGFEQPVHVDRELPGYLTSVLCRLVVMRAGCDRIRGPLADFAARLPFHRVRVLDLSGCNVTGDLPDSSGKAIEVLPHPLLFSSLPSSPISGDIEVFKGMNIDALDLCNCEELTGAGVWVGWTSKPPSTPPLSHTP